MPHSKSNLAQAISLKHDLLLRGIHSNISSVSVSEESQEVLLELLSGLFVRARFCSDVNATPYQLQHKNGGYHIKCQNYCHKLMSVEFVEKSSRIGANERGLMFQKTGLAHLPYVLLSKRPETYEAVDFCVQQYPDLICFELDQLSAAGESRIQVERNQQDNLKILKYATEVFPKSSVSAVLTVNLHKTEQSKTDMEILGRMGILPLLKPQISEHEIHHEDDLHRLEELTVCAYKICVISGLNLAHLRQLSTVIHPAEGQALEQTLSSIKRTLLQLNRTELFSRRKARLA